MPKILSKEKLSENISKIVVEAPHVAKATKPGQFIVVVPTENAERIPLTIADFDKKQGTITIIFQIVGATTRILNSLKEGDNIAHILGPLGVPSHMEKFGTVVVIGGGVGIAEIYPVVKSLKETGNEVITIIGARCKELLIYESELRTQSAELKTTTDDGSSGRKGFVSDELKDIINSGKKIDRVIVVGPVPMMRVCCDVTKPLAIKTMVSLNTLMLDATGMCGICRVTVGGETKFACVEGPEFDGHQVDFGELASRLSAYKNKEKEADNHVCRLLKNG
ncbi:ferredoxin-NADP reductase [candidate division WOR-1 bacterium RIFOXYC2_FULL_37_10]|uniref:Ferredoxin-NADP reductase n=1 Tax=candidate division WOR-1 bacterium RIFOXYB2_FULL_37_13 TaxID=1802579 RepID=A0A1F4SM60_UNCSA|nr:MAG: ferredoxin-NADP reductase [candidate division WOR-1 bacterium RIFOXYA2_FULL_37_7]OGC21457.1 MAG: ferredoxin-NADP reductase [candidate division WOR-1 bacterium RIFOXYB2_FULL_37_13]OGC35341.1 MAG: ferredoxin-NADP reductase [candidate division WOR-1 bacterium RIFOXYC2_FULL_37_10]